MVVTLSFMPLGNHQTTDTRVYPTVCLDTHRATGINKFSAKSGVRNEEKAGAGQGATVEVPGGWRATGRRDRVSMKARKEGMGRQCTADGRRCQEYGGQWASEIARGFWGDGQA